MAVIQTQTIIAAGVTPVLSPCSAGGDSFYPAAETFLMIHNSDTAPHIVTVDVTAEAFGQPVQDVTVAVAAGATVLAGPFPPGMVANVTTGLASVAYDNASTLTLAVLTT